MVYRDAITRSKKWYKAQTPPVQRVVLFGAVVTLWMLTGLISFSSEEQTPPPAPFKVLVQPSTAQEVERLLTLRGEARPDQTANIKAETTGRVAELRLPKGTEVKRGDVLFTLAPDSRLKKIAEAKANLEYQEKEFKTAKGLEQQGFQARNSLSAARANLERARANLSDMELDYSNSQVKAPFDGIYEDRFVDVGDSVALGANLAKVIDIDPLVLEGFVPQNAIGRVDTTRPVRAKTLSGIELEGTIRYLASQADPVTRTYAIEVVVPNPELLRIAGSSVTMQVSEGLEKAHYISSAFLSLSADGTMGVKALGEDNKVLFYPAEIIRADAEGVWLSGIPDTATLITVGHGYVSEGQVVDPQYPPEVAPQDAPQDAQEAAAE